jgi:hypothetical protein
VGDVRRIDTSFISMFFSVKTDPYSRTQPVHQAYREFFGKEMSVRERIAAKQ